MEDLALEFGTHNYDMMCIQVNFLKVGHISLLQFIGKFKGVMN